MTGETIQDVLLPAVSSPLVAGALAIGVGVIILVAALTRRRRRSAASRPTDSLRSADPEAPSPSARTATATVAAPELEKTMTKASDLFVACLEAEGCEYVFGVPGEENLDFLDSLSRSRKIKLILTRHEQGAGFMAATYGRHTGKAGVCLATLGPGATNLVTAAAYAQLGGMPMLMITGQKPIKSSKQGRFQILDVVDMMRPISKFTHQLASADNIPARVREAVRLAQEEKPGATHLEFPEDIAHEQTTVPVIVASQVRRPVADDKSIRVAVDRIARAKSPLLIIGAGANRKLTSRMLTELVEKTGIPYITTQLGKGVIDERNPKYLGCAALSSGDFVHRIIEAADVIINVGHDVIEKPPFFMKAGGCDVIHIGFRSAEVDPVYFPQIEVVGDIANAIWQIKETLAVQPHWSFDPMIRAHQAELDHTAAAVGDMRCPIYPQHLVDQVRKIMPSDGILCLDNGVYKIWFTRSYPAHMPNTFLVDNALATMGAGLPSAMASAMIFPNRKVMAVCGDGGFMMNSQELETAVRLKLNLVVLILNDNSYGMIRWKQANMGFEDWGLTYGNPDFVKYAESYGAHGHRVTSAEGMPALLQQCLDTPGVHVVEVPIDYVDNDRILNKDVRELSAALPV
jgi:acetolactate synthase I/II/III large subunit